MSDIREQLGDLKAGLELMFEVITGIEKSLDLKDILAQKRIKEECAVAPEPKPITPAYVEAIQQTLWESEDEPKLPKWYLERKSLGAGRSNAYKQKYEVLLGLVQNLKKECTTSFSIGSFGSIVRTRTYLGLATNSLYPYLYDMVTQGVLRITRKSNRIWFIIN